MNTQYSPSHIAILGRQPALGIAELESLYGAQSVQPFGAGAALLGHDATDVDFARLGGSMRLARIITQLPSCNWNNIESYITSTFVPGMDVVDGKMSFGISVYGIKANPRAVAKTAILTKKAIKKRGQSVRMVPHSTLTLGTATVLYNKLTKADNLELLVVSDGSTAYLARTVAIQDIDAYAARDQARPARDAKVGMLPPKLAQILINLATGLIASNEQGAMSKERRDQVDLRRSPLVLDPFCGTGVLLQEATLMDYNVYGTDIEPRMIEYSIKNLAWLDEKYPDVGDYRKIEAGDATKHDWGFSKLPLDNPRVVVAAETFLGHPLSTLPNNEHLSKIIYEANVINHRFLQNIAPQLQPGTRLALGVPTWRGKREFLHLPLLDHLTDMGYTRVRFTHASDTDLIYHRDGQIVGRELLVLIKN